MSSLINGGFPRLRKCLFRLLQTITCLLIALAFYHGTQGSGFRYWAAIAFFCITFLFLVDLLVFVITEVHGKYIESELWRVERESKLNGVKDSVGSKNWLKFMAMRRDVLLNANRRVTLLMYCFGWLNPYVFSHCHRLMIDWRWELKDWRGVAQSIKWTKSVFAKSSDSRISACHVVWDFWKNGRLPCSDDFTIQYLMSGVWNKNEAYLPFFLAAWILLENRNKNEAMKILSSANDIQKSPVLTQFMSEVRKDRWKKSRLSLGGDILCLDFGNCIQLALKEQSANTK